MFTKTDIERYFIAEKQESLLFVIIGITALLFGLAGIFIWKTQAWKGAAIPLMAIALIQVVVGYTVYARSDQQRVDAVYAFDMNPSKLRNEELPRMQTVIRNFVIYRWVELALLATGLILYFISQGYTGKQFLLGVGLGLAIQATLMLAADYFAERRAKIYHDGLRSHLEKRT